MFPPDGSKSFVDRVPEARSGVDVIKGARDTEPRREVETSCLSPGPRPVASRLNPDEALIAAKARVGWLEAALAVLAESDSAEAHALRQVLQQARRSAQEQPINVQIKDTEDFIVRSTNRLEVLAKKHVEEERLLESAKIRLTRLKEMAIADRTPSARPTELDIQVAELKAKLAAMEAERDQARRNAERQHEGRQGTVQDTQPQGPAPKRACWWEEHFIPNCDEEMQEWMADRHQDLQAALVAGQLAEVARVSNPLDTSSAGVATDDRRPVRQRQHAVCGGQLCEVIRHQCGMVGVRVGEATNPGPVGPGNEELLDCLQRDLSRVPRRVRRRVMDSDSGVPLLRVDPSEAQDRRDVIEGHVASTQPASLGLEAFSNQSTVLGRVESQQLASTVPASSGMVRAIQRGRNPERDTVRSMRLRNRFSPLANYEQDGGDCEGFFLI